MVLEIEVQGARQVERTMPEAVRIFIKPPSEETLRTRLIGRGTDDMESVERRLQVAKAELAASGEFPHVVHNDRVDDAVAELEQIVRTLTRDAHGAISVSSRCRRGRGRPEHVAEGRGGRRRARAPAAQPPRVDAAR